MSGSPPPDQRSSYYERTDPEGNAPEPASLNPEPDGEGDADEDAEYREPGVVQATLNGRFDRGGSRTSELREAVTWRLTLPQLGHGLRSAGGRPVGSSIGALHPRYRRRRTSHPSPEPPNSRCQDSGQNTCNSPRPSDSTRQSSSAFSSGRGTRWQLAQTSGSPSPGRCWPSKVTVCSRSLRGDGYQTACRRLPGSLRFLHPEYKPPRTDRSLG